MEHSRRFILGLVIAALGMIPGVRAAALPGFGEVSGTVTGVPASSIVPVYLFNKERNVGYGVFVSCDTSTLVVDGMSASANNGAGERNACR